MFNQQHRIMTLLTMFAGILLFSFSIKSNMNEYMYDKTSDLPNSSYLMPLAVSISLTQKTAFAQRTLIVPDVSKEATDFERLIINVAVKYDHFEVAENVEVHPTGFRMMVSGEYCIFSNIVYKPKVLCPQLTSKFWTHRMMIKQRKDSTEARVLKSSQYNCTITTEIIKKSDYIGKVVNLEVGDILYVEVSWRAPLEKKSRDNYFGLFPIGTRNPSSCEGMATEA